MSELSDKQKKILKNIAEHVDRKILNVELKMIYDDINKPVDNIDKTTDKYKVLLKFVNKILVNVGKIPITDLREFKGIKREDLIKDITSEIYNNMETELFDCFDKKKCSWYNRKNVNYYVITFLRSATRNIGLHLKLHEKCTHKGKLIVKYTIYSIV